MAYSNITVETKDFVTVVTLNRPPMNSVNLGIREELDKLVGEIQTSKDTRVVVLTGSGEKAFCAGMDVSDVANIDKGPNGIDVCNKIERSLKPVIAVINGHALGGGCELAMACHFRFMTDNPKAMIGCPELNLGLTPGWGGIQRMPRIIGKSKALDFIFFSKKITGPEALAIGLVDKVFPAADLMKEAMNYATALSKRAPIPVSAVLEGMTVGLEKDINAGLEIDKKWIEKIKKSTDAVEGMTAFFEKREPTFKGE
ncbi:MAG: enoyl-CoA hydratase [Deltaproteobacteria bacterium HGW-Deltaproteobacteria-13]|jgi:enoyl-CoA hydratase/carnithine racemase|nr:MAG: enoyl-CoA hydratase [Deltaproteobacteria bacterium HGW-Deltaproteobacteria-13]